ncbi:MAG TPA: alpha/beta fold hydrolase [Gallionellaceae bacterium]
MIKLIAILLAALGAVAYVRSRRDIDRAFLRIAAGSQIAETPCGPIEYAVAGEGPPVLVVHGAGGGFDQGLDLGAELVAAGFRVIAPSRFGYLRTPLPADASAAAQADAHACLLDALNVPRAAVMGASAGAPSAMQLALRHPQRVAALVLMVPAAYAPRTGQAPVQRPKAAIWLAETMVRSDFVLWAMQRLAPGLAVRALLGTPPQLVQSASPPERARVELIMQHVLPISVRRRGLLNDTAVVTDLPRYALENIAAPTLACSLEDDLYGTYEGARYSAAHIPNARFIGYPSGGHMGVGHNDEFAAAVAALLKSARYTG